MDIENVFHSQAEGLVKKATSGTTGTPDWSTILRILGIIDTSSVTIPTFLNIICKYLSRGKKGTSLNCLILVDALFKNSKRAQLTLLQSPQLLQQLNSPMIQRNPELHNFLYKSAPSWVSTCAAQNCLDQYFASWQESICRSHYVPKMTDAIKSKLSLDIDASLEVLVMFSQCLITSYVDGGNADDPLLMEIMPNIREITRRIVEIEPTIIDREIRLALKAMRTFCEMCHQVMAEYKKTKQIDANSVIIAITKAQSSVKKHLSALTTAAENGKTKKRVPLRRRGQPFDEMSVEDFFEEFDKIKKMQKKQSHGQIQGQIQQKQVDNLLDFEMPLEPPQVTAGAQSQADELIDSLIQI